MLKSRVKFHSANGKRMIMIVEDEEAKQKDLEGILANDYELLFASSGKEALELAALHHDMISLIMLDLTLPDIPGLQVLSRIKGDPQISVIPVIIVSSNQAAEVDSLNAGAIDFIPKPYPVQSVVQARILRSIELSEDREIISLTERDPLTGLYNREYFYHYAEQFDQHHKEMEMDAIVLDVNHFHMINERFGTAYCDEILRRIGEKVREMVRDTGGIVCRRAADTFMVYCPHGKDYKAILDSASIGLTAEDTSENRVRLRMGVYACVDKSLEIARRFDRAKLASDTVRNNYAKSIGIYDHQMNERELYAEQLIEHFHQAISDREFSVYYQPKFDIRPEKAVLCGAEALVRWKHPSLGMIGPQKFIPLFEENGLIQSLDAFVWIEVARQISEWKTKYDHLVPVSINVSRIDMFDPHLPQKIMEVIQGAGLTPKDFHLEITESAYTEDSEQIVEMVGEMRELGFQIEMDDFGSGYSSLNMISTLPIDALKLDMQLIRNAFLIRKDTRMLELMIDIADYLKVPVIAEGVETEEQILALKKMKCDIVQGYYFSRPVPAEDFEVFLKEKARESRE